MTTTVNIEASCSDEKQVHITINEDGLMIEQMILQNGEDAVRYVYDGREIIVKEAEKA